MTKHQLFAKVDWVDYLGHIISVDGVSVDPSKINTIQEWPVPMSISTLRGFLCLSGYYRCFVKDYATIAGPLTDLLKAGTFKWNEKAEVAFQQLKQTMTSLPVLHLLDFSSSFDVTTNASGSVLGVVLSQNVHPIAFFSKKLCPRM